MPSKLDQAAKYGFDIEVFFEDLDYVARAISTGSMCEKRLEAAHIIRSLCDERGIQIVCIQPFMHYEGLRDRHRHAQKISEMECWIALAKVLRTDIISIPSTFLSENEVSGDLDLVVEDMREVADLASPHGIRIAYEALAWGTYVNTWEQAWDVVRRVDSWNFGICLDTFNMAGRIFADPAATSRKTPIAEKALEESLERLRTIDPSKVLYVQVVDAEYLAQPLSDGHKYYKSEQPARMSWSRNCRLFYGESELGAYLPVKEILQVILQDLRFEGFVSAELFNISLTKPDISVPREHAKRAARSFQKMSEDLGVDFQSCRRKSRTCSTASKEFGSRAQL